jgi:hypothetical protein
LEEENEKLTVRSFLASGHFSKVCTFGSKFYLINEFLAIFL